MDFNFLKKIAPIAEEEGTVYNRSALNALKAQRDAEAEMAAQLAAGTDSPLTAQPFKQSLSGIDISKLPSQSSIDKPLNINLDKGNLGEAIPSSASSINLDPNQDIGAISPESRAANWQKYKKPALAGAAAGTALALSSDSSSPSAQAAKIDPPSEPTASKAPSPEDDNAKDLSDMKDLMNSDGESKGMAASSSKAPSLSEKQEEVPVSAQADIDNSKNLGSVEKLRQLQEQMKEQLATNNAGRIGAAMSTGMSGIDNPYDKIFQDRAKQIENVPEQYIKQVDFQKSDPNSPVSKAYRNLAAMIDPTMKITDQMSAADLEKVNPELGQVKTREDMIAMRKEVAQDKLAEMKYRDQMMALAREDRSTQKQKDAETKELNLADKTMDTWAAKMALPSSRTAMGQAQIQKYSIERVKALLNGHPLNDINPNELAEIAKGLDRVITGTSTISGSADLNPRTAKAYIAHVLQQVQNKSVGAGASDFLKRIDYNLNNEGLKADDQLRKSVKTLLSGSDRYANHKNPEIQQKFQKFLANNDLPADLFEKKEVPKPGSQSAPAVPGDASKAPPPPSKMVQMKTPDGKLWTVPSDKVETAKARGAVEVQ